MVYGGLKKHFFTTTHAHSLISCVLELILSFSLGSANMGSFPETQNDLTLKAYNWGTG